MNTSTTNVASSPPPPAASPHPYDVPRKTSPLHAADPSVLRAAAARRGARQLRRAWRRGGWEAVGAIVMKETGAGSREGNGGHRREW